jgi:hypothetical protein
MATSLRFSPLWAFLACPPCCRMEILQGTETNIAGRVFLRDYFFSLPALASNPLRCVTLLIQSNILHRM